MVIDAAATPVMKLGMRNQAMRAIFDDKIKVRVADKYAGARE